MPDLPRKKVGLISCSGEDHPCGTLSRVATRLVLEQLRPADTVTLCLPLFLAGEESERAFARFYPTVAIDGCDKRCAALATARYSGPVARGLVLDRLLEGMGVQVRPDWRRRLDAEGMAAAQEVAEIIARQVDHVIEAGGRPALIESVVETTAGTVEVATCSCGSEIPVLRLVLQGRTVELLGVPALFDLFCQDGRAPAPETTAALLAQARIYNNVTPEDESELVEALDAAYREYWRSHTSQPRDKPKT